MLGNEDESFRCKHLWVVGDYNFLVVQVLVIRLCCHGNRLVEREAGAVMAVCIDVCEDRHKVWWLLSLTWEIPSCWLTKLKIQINYIYYFFGQKNTCLFRSGSEYVMLICPGKHFTLKGNNWTFDFELKNLYRVTRHKCTVITTCTVFYFLYIIYNWHSLISEKKIILWVFKFIVLINFKKFVNLFVNFFTQQEIFKFII